MGDPHDIVFLNAAVADGSGDEPIVTDVAVRGDRIERIGDFHGPAKRYVDAFGRVLAPGFVDFHSHSDYSLLIDPLGHSKIHQGVTTEIGGNCGYHAAPVFGEVSKERQREYGRFLPTVEWRTSAEYIRAWHDLHPSVNYGQQIGYNTLRGAVTTDRGGRLTDDERSELRRLVRQDLTEHGYIGVSYGIAYPPACYSTTEELVDVADEAAEVDALISFHIRDEGDKLMESLEEALLIGDKSGARIHIGHLKAFRRPNWHKLEAAIALLNGAKKKGMRLTADRYPHLAMNTQLRAALPQWVHEGGVEAMKQRLGNPEQRDKIVAELEAAVGDEAEEVLIALVGKSENRHMEGRFLDQIADGRNPWQVLCEILADEGDSAFATFFGMNRDNLDQVLALDYCIVGSDASVQAIDRQAGGGRPHPRSFNTFPYFLAEWVFARKLVDLGTAIRKVTSLPAELAGIKNRGRIAEGYHADLVLIDPSGLQASVDYERPINFPSGIEMVTVNGEITVEHGRHTGARAGRFLRRDAIGT